MRRAFWPVAPGLGMNGGHLVPAAGRIDVEVKAVEQHEIDAAEGTVQRTSSRLAAVSPASGGG